MFNDIIVVMKIGANIMREREKAGLSQEQLAVKIHITQQQLALYERDLQEMSVTRLQEIAETLKIPVANLLR
jgi:transcriptional regulator with XRE-family HTH domain